MPGRASELELSGPSRAKRSARLEALLQDGSLDSNLAQVLLDIESVPATISDYRERERHLETLLKTLRDDDHINSEMAHTYSFRYLLGSLYINFEKFWGPTIRIIIELLRQTRFQSNLLRILLDHLAETNDLIYCTDGTDSTHAEDRPDHILHRNFIFQLMARFTSYIESNNSLFMDQFFRFVNKEMLASPFIEKFTRSDLTRFDHINDQCEETMQIDMYQFPTESIPINHGKRKGLKKKTQLPAVVLEKRKSRETFITAAKIIQSFKNISNIHRENELRDLIDDLLCCRDCSVQKAAFNCLLAYENESIKPYVEKLLRILNDKKVRNELTMFSIDAEKSDQVNPQHRPQMIPILQRILFGRMISQVGRKSSGSDKADLRKTLVMRFIAGCSLDEIINFFSLLFEPIFVDIETPYERLESNLREKLDIKSYIPLNKLQAMLDSLSAFMSAVSHLKDGTLKYVLKLLSIVLYYVVTPLENKELLEKISEKHVNSLKVLRRSCINLMTIFFRSFEYYRYTQVEINYIFEKLVWPSCRGFIDKNHASVTPMLRLIESLAANKVYHKLFVKRNTLNRDEYLLQHIIDLYRDAKTERSVSKFIASIILNIIKPDRDAESDDAELKEEDVQPNQILVDDAVEPVYNRDLYRIPDEEMSYGLSIVVSFTPTIFARLNQNCQEFIEKKDSTSKIEIDELTILSALSRFLKNSEQSLIATRLLLTTFAHQKNDDLILDTLRTCQTLMRQVDNNNDPQILINIANILGYQRNLAQREELCILIDVLAEKDSKLTLASQAIRLMNATSEELLNMPDLAKWNEGFQLSFNLLDNLCAQTLQEPETIRETLILLIHQTGYIINTVDKYEFSVRENCQIFYEKLAKQINLIPPEGNSSFFQQILNDILLEKFIKKGLRDTNSTIRHTYIGVLRALALQCNQKNKILGEFFMFCDQNADLDFWLNIKHIQLHNRSRALARLIANEQLNKVAAKTLSSYFLPLASGFLFNKAYKSVASLSENSIKLIGLICRHLNWVTYESTLGYYLGLLTKANATYQRTNIKLITEIIKNFHFDLTACEEAMQHEEENKKLELRMRKRLGYTKDCRTNIVDRPKKLNSSTAKMVYFSIMKKLIPRLNSCLHEMTRVEFEHDKKMSGYLPETDEIKRIPIAFAIVQLLSLLPGRYILFRDHLPGLFLKLASFLKSKNEATRKAARMTLIRMMTFEPIGPAYLPDLLRVLKQNLDKGFQVHVLNYTIHSVLDKLKNNNPTRLHHGDLDSSAHELIESCMKEIFGAPSEDKEIAQIIAKTSEAKKTKSYDTLLILSSYISPEKLDSLMSSIKGLLKTSTDSKKVNKLSVCLQRIFSGLAENEDYPLDELLDFIQGTIQESIPSLRVKQKVDQVENAQTFNSKNPLREDRFLVGRDLTKERIKSKINEKGNLHMLVENSLRLLLLTFEKKKAEIKRKETLQKKLDSFIGLLTVCLKSSSPRCVMRTLKCIHFITQTKSNLPSFKLKCNSIVKKIFVLLSLYNGVGMVQGDNYEMIGMCFKTLTLLFLNCEHVNLNDIQVRALMTYIEQDLHDVARQATAFGTLHSLLKRKLKSPELPDIMHKIADLLVTSGDDSVRALSIKIWQTYILEYEHEGTLLQTHLTRFLRQIDYKFIDGRKSVLKMIKIIIEKFPERILRDYVELFFHLLAQRVVNDDSKEIRKIVGHIIALLIQRLPDKQAFLLNQFVLPWSSQTNIELKTLGIKLSSIFLEASRSTFDKNNDRISKLLIIVQQALDLAKDQSKQNGTKRSRCIVTDNAESGEQQVRLASNKDKLNYHALRLFKRLVDKEIITYVETRHLSILKTIWQDIAESKMTSWHGPIVMTSCELYRKFIANTTLNEALKVEVPSKENYLEWNATRIVRLLCDNYIELLDRFEPKDKLFSLIMEGLILLGQMIANSKATLEFEQKYCESFTESDVLNHMLNLETLPSDGFAHEHLPYQMNDAKKRANLMWLSIKVIMQARKEAALFRMSKTYRRDFVLKWTAAVAQELGPSRLPPYVFLFIMTPVRELTDKVKNTSSDGSTSNQSITVLSEDLLKFMKGLLGLEVFNKVYSKVQLHYTKKRIERKKSEALLRVKDQARGVKRKLKKRKDKDAKRKKSRIEARNVLKGHIMRSNKRLRS